MSNCFAPTYLFTRKTRWLFQQGRSEVRVRTGLKGQGASQGSGLENILTNIEVLTECGQTTPVIEITNITQILYIPTHINITCTGSCCHSVSLRWHRRAPVHTRDHRGTPGYTVLINFSKTGTRSARVRGARAPPIRASAPQSGDERQPNLAAALR